MKFNTAIAAMMTLINKVYDLGKLTRDEFVTFITLLARLHPTCAGFITPSWVARACCAGEVARMGRVKTVDEQVEIAVRSAASCAAPS